MNGLTCSICGASITSQSRSGQCIYCSRRGSRYTKGRHCSICGKPIGDRTKYNLCLQHVRKRYRGKYPTKAWRKVQHQAQRTETMATCHMPGCDRQFYLESWQHPQMAYCPECRKREEYTGYRSRIWLLQKPRPSLTTARFSS